MGDIVVGSMSGRDCVAKGGKKKMELKMKEWEKLRVLEGTEKDGTEEEGFFVADGKRTGLRQD